MNIEERVKIAEESRKRGYNCCQAVLCAFSDKYDDFTESQMLKVAEGFGGGMGLLSVCGAVPGMVMVAGLENADGNTEKNTTKGATRKIAVDFQNKFKEKNQSLICSELKGVETKKVLRSCEGCIEDAIRIVGEYLGEK